MTALLCAKKIAGLAQSAGIPLTNLKLQKLVYYCQAWHLALRGGELFPDNIEAWVHGPVVRGVFAYYKQCNGAIEPIQCDAADAHLQEVFQAYGSFDGLQLERMTHSELPWMEARAGLAPDAPSRNIISVATMRDFYRKLNG